MIENSLWFNQILTGNLSKADTNPVNKTDNDCGTLQVITGTVALLVVVGQGRIMPVEEKSTV